MEHAQEEENRHVKNLRGAGYNPRTITAAQLDRLKKALHEFGDLSGIIFNRRSGLLVGGHQRCKVIPRDAPIEIVNRYDPASRTGTIADGYIIIDGERLNYREVDWDEEKEKTANIAANAHGGDWDEQKLHDLLKECVQANSIDNDLIGFDLADLHQILGEDLINDSPADNLMVMSEQLRNSREIFKEVQKNLEKIDDIMHCYLVVIFKKSEDRKKFTDDHKLPDNRYIDARELEALIKR